MIKGYAEAPFGQVHYRELGANEIEGGAPIVLLHQAPMDSRQFDNVYEPLARRGFRAIGIDMPGFGGTDLQPGVPSVELYSECVVPVLDHLGLDKVALVGHHTGSLVATEAAVRWPERFSALVINGPLPLTLEERDEWLATGHIRELGIVPREGGTHFTQVFERRTELSRGTVPPERISSYVIQAFGGQAPFWHGHYAAYTYDHGASLAKVTVPALILTNTGDVIYPKAQRAREIRPDLAYAELEGGGIDIVDQQPEEWADAVAGWLKSVG
jgi:pimeloyl-ACP methyl ester carboxylesterase